MRYTSGMRRGAMAMAAAIALAAAGPSGLWRVVPTAKCGMAGAPVPGTRGCCVAANHGVVLAHPVQAPHSAMLRIAVAPERVPHARATLPALPTVPLNSISSSPPLRV